jgi:hypothetical protein
MYSNTYVKLLLEERFREAELQRRAGEFRRAIRRRRFGRS